MNSLQRFMEDTNREARKARFLALSPDLQHAVSKRLITLIEAEEQMIDRFVQEDDRKEAYDQNQKLPVRSGR